MAVADYSGQAWLQGFNEVGIAIFGMTANALLEIRVRRSTYHGSPVILTRDAKDRDTAEYNTIMHRANCNTFNFSCRAKQDTYNVCISFVRPFS